MGYNKDVLMGVHNDDIEHHISELKRINNKIKENVTELKKKVLNINDDEGACLRVVF